jgi:hypothetical protein
MISFKQFILEGGVAGHMAHPFDLPSANTGKDLINIFKKAISSLQKTPASVKIDGINTSIKIITNKEGNKEFALDRGSNKPDDVEGVTISKLASRFPAGHGMIQTGKTVLQIFNSSIAEIEPELQKLEMWDNPKIVFNMEYVQGNTNVIGYTNNFLAIHGLNKIIEVRSPVRGSISRASREIFYNKKTLKALIEKINPIARKYGFDVEHEFAVKIKPVNIENSLNKPLSISYSSKNIVTKSIKEWLAKANNPRTEKIKLASNKTISALSLENYKNIVGGIPLNIYLSKDSKDIEKAINGAVFYYATILMGEAVKRASSSSLGSLHTQEGIVIRDPSIASVPVKITGSFILGKEQGKFASKKTEEEEYGVAGQLKNVSNVNNANNYQTDPPYSKAIYRGVLTPGMAL